MTLLAVDPGKTTGWALFRDSQLVACGKVTGASAAVGNLPVADTLVIEEPRIRRRHPRPNDILQLAVLVGQIAAHYVQVRRVAPEEWKGQMPKDVCWKRANAKLTWQERTLVWPKGFKMLSTRKLDHNIKDAIALGLSAIGRFK